MSFCRPGGELDQLLWVQRGDLGGPRPPRDAGPLAGGAIVGGQLITQQDLARMAGQNFIQQNLQGP